MSTTPVWAIPYVPENTNDPAAGLNLALLKIDESITQTVVDHEAAADPHPQYTTAAEAAAAAPVQDNDARLTDSRTPTGGAGGVLSGTYPNPGWAVDMATQAELNAVEQAKLNISALADDLITNDPARPLSANQGVQLKALIDNIETLLNSDNINLDTLQEIVDFIELNRATLDTLGIGNIAGLQAALDSKVDKITGKGLSTEDYTTAEKTKLTGIAAGAQVNVATNLAQGTRTATAVPITSSTGASATLGAPTSTLAGVMTAALFTKLSGIATGATANASDAQLRDRATHTGTQAATTVTIADAGNYFAGTNTETVLQEVGAMLGDVGAALDTINGAVI